MGHQSGLQLPMFEIAVEVLLGGSEHAEKVLLFTPGERQPVRGVLEILEGERMFLSAREVETRSFNLLNKAAIVWVGLPRPEAAPAEEGLGGEELELYDTQRKVQIELENRGFVEGSLLYSAPSARSRLSDFINGPERFLCLWRRGDVLLIHKRFILRLQELAEAASSEPADGLG